MIKNKIVLFLVNDIKTIYNYRLELVEKLIENKNTIIISSPYGDKVDEIKKRGCVFIETKLSRHGTNPYEDMKLMKFYKKIIKDISPDVVFTFTIKPNIYGGIICNKLRVPYIVNVTGFGMAMQNQSILKKIVLKMYRCSLRHATKVFFQNEYNLQFAKDNKLVKDNYELIPGSGVNLEKYKYIEYPNNNSQINVITVGRIMKDKGIDELLQAIDIIKSKYENVNFNLIGDFDGDYRKKISDAVNKNVINYIGYTDNVLEYLEKCNVIVHPSYHEGMSNVLLEAAAVGRPIIATNIPGCKEIFDEGVSGFGCEPRNVESLVEAISKFIETPYEQKRDMGKKARSKIEKIFDRNIVINKYIEEVNKIG